MEKERHRRSPEILSSSLMCTIL